MKIKKVSIIGGCGHIGLPLGMVIAKSDTSIDVRLIDINEENIKLINNGVMPFMEDGSEILKTLTNIKATSDSEHICDSQVVIFVLGTEVDKHLKPETKQFWDIVNSYEPYFQYENQLIIIRSTVFPGTTKLFKEKYGYLDVVCCPERTVQGSSLKELVELPQIIGSDEKSSGDLAEEFFSKFVKSTIRVSTLEAELAKLFTNSYRYINFAITNYFYMLANDIGVDYNVVYNTMVNGYDRMNSFPKAGFAAGPCLFKDTMQLSAFSIDGFQIGHIGMVINEKLPYYIVNKAKKDFGNLSDKTIGILGMAFKAESDDIRESLSYSLKRFFSIYSKNVICTDPYVKRNEIMSLETVLSEADILVVGAPHKCYNSIKTNKPIIDIWNIIKK